MDKPPNRDKWSAAKLAYTAERRSLIMTLIQGTNVREGVALHRVRWALPMVREQIRNWYRERWMYLVGEYEKVLPHVDELPDER